MYEDDNGVEFDYDAAQSGFDRALSQVMGEIEGTSMVVSDWVMIAAVTDLDSGENYLIASAGPTTPQHVAKGLLHTGLYELGY